MKYSILSILFLATILMAFKRDVVLKTDDYKVIKVQGNIVFKNTGKAMSQGDVFKENTVLNFASDDAKATVINADKGRFVLTKSAKGSNLIPAINNIASRSGAILNLIDLQNHFEGKLAIIDGMKIKIASTDFKMDDNSFFYLEYKYKGEIIPKKLGHVGDSLVIDKAQVYKVDGTLISAPDSPEVTLKYRNSKENKNTTISTFNLVFPNSDELKGEISIILDEMKSKSIDKKIDEVVSYVNEFYGKPDKSNVKYWVGKNFGVK